ncbi:MAG: DUF1223 domain-containing protein [Hyphomicrobiales bacterium]|nr:MAG: DUF1223 domain-containing protein [Hyphomicrobiales bacterium]
MPASRFLACVPILLFLFAAPASASDPAPGNVSVLELFTSQGCSSCPPADALMGEFSKQPGLVALTYAVDYWDYLGWKDTLAKPAYSRRQRAYAVARADRNVYTPQVIINGITHAVGSRKSQIDSRIASTSKKLRPIHVPVQITETGDKLTVTLGKAPDALTDRQATLWLVLYQSSVEVKITRGENRGRKITYHNVVREMTPAGMWDGAMKTIDLSKSALSQSGYDGFALLLQQKTGGAILGAARGALPVLKMSNM